MPISITARRRCAGWNNALRPLPPDYSYNRYMGDPLHSPNPCLAPAAKAPFYAIYWLTAKALRIGQAYVDSAQMPRMLRPIVEQVARTTQEHVSVGTRDGDEIVHIVRSRYSHIASLSIRPGSRVPMYCTASGRLWLAALSAAELDEYLSRVTLHGLMPYTCTDVEALRAELVQVARQGYCCVDQEYEAGMLVLGVPLLNRGGQLRATLTITTHTSRVAATGLRERYLTALYEAQALLRPVLD